MNIEVTNGLIVQLTLAEAKQFIPKRKVMISEQISKAEKDLAQTNKIRENFEENFNKLTLALNPLLANLNI